MKSEEQQQSPLSCSKSVFLSVPPSHPMHNVVSIQKSFSNVTKPKESTVGHYVDTGFIALMESLEDKVEEESNF